MAYRVHYADRVHDRVEHLLENRWGGYENPRDAWADATRELAPVDLGVAQRVQDACWKAAKGNQQDYERRVRAYKAKVLDRQRVAAATRTEVRNQVRAATAEGLVVEALPPITHPEEIPDSWEDEADKLPASQAVEAPRVKKVAVATYEDGAVPFEVPHGHAVLAASRMYGDTSLRGRCAAECLGVIRANPLARAAVVDVGAGATGIKGALSFITTYRQMDMIYFHCMFPSVTAADLDRENTLKTMSASINWVDAGQEPLLGFVNACRHTAKECDCLRLYTHRAIMAVHSSYYFDDEDWANLFRYSDMVHTYQHVPTGLQPVPLATPEFTWSKVEFSRTATKNHRRVARMRQKLVQQDDMLVFEPLRSHGTTYFHRDPRIDLEAGGFHLSNSWVHWLNALGLNETFLKRLGWAMFAGDVTLTALVISAVINGISASSVAAVASCLVIGSIPFAACNLAWKVRSSHVPSALATATVRVVNGKAVKYQGEEIAHFFSYCRGPVGCLEPRNLSSYVPDKKLALELASTALLSKKDAPTVKALLTSKALRDGVDEATAVATVAEALAITTRCTKNGGQTSPTNLDPGGLEAWQFVSVPPMIASLVGLKLPFTSLRQFVLAGSVVFVTAASVRMYTPEKAGSAMKMIEWHPAMKDPTSSDGPSDQPSVLPLVRQTRAMRFLSDTSPLRRTL